MLVLPELFAPKNPVKGAICNLPVFFHDLKFCILSSVIMMYTSLSDIERGIFLSLELHRCRPYRAEAFWHIHGL